MATMPCTDCPVGKARPGTVWPAGSRVLEVVEASFEEMIRMRFIGLLLLAATAAFTGLAIADNLSGGPEYSVSVLGNHIATMNTLEIFCSGLALALIFCLGLVMAAGGTTHRSHHGWRTHGRRHSTSVDEMTGRDARA
jgi:hypothetical protein